MAQNIGTLITAAIRPNDDLDLIASAFQNEIKGGHHTYATLVERDAIIEERREWGMFTSVYSDGANTGDYQLEYNLVDTDINNNSNWSSFSGGTGTGGTDTFTGLTDTVITSPLNGDNLIYSLRKALRFIKNSLGAPDVKYVAKNLERLIYRERTSSIFFVRTAAISTENLKIPKNLVNLLRLQ